MSITYRIVQETPHDNSYRVVGSGLSESDAASCLLHYSFHEARFAELEDGYGDEWANGIRYVADMDENGKLYLINVEDI